MKKPVLREPLKPLVRSRHVAAFSRCGEQGIPSGSSHRKNSSENFPLPAPLKHLNLSTKIPTTTT